MSHAVPIADACSLLATQRRCHLLANCGRRCSQQNHTPVRVIATIRSLVPSTYTGQDAVPLVMILHGCRQTEGQHDQRDALQGSGGAR